MFFFFYSNLYKNQVKTTSNLEEKLEKLTKNTKKHCNENKNSKIDDEYNKSSKNNGLKCNRDCRPSNNNKITSDVVIYTYYCTRVLTFVGMHQKNEYNINYNFIGT